MKNKNDFTQITAKKVIEEFWMSFLDKNNIRRGIIIKKLSDGSFLIPTGKDKIEFTFSELLKDIKINNENNLVTLPFIVGTTDFPAIDSMNTKTFEFFIKELAQALGIPEPQKEIVN